MPDPLPPLPDPLTGPDIDVRDLDGFMLNAERLLASELLALSTGDEFKAAVRLWCRAWKQMPAASLPNDDRILASFAGLMPKHWQKVKEMAMRGWVLCSDGRLYHPLLCEDARRGFEAKEARRAEHQGDADRKRREREDRSRLFEQLRVAGRIPSWNTSTRDLRRMVTGLPPPVTRDSHGPDTVTVTVSQGQGQGQGQEDKKRAPPSPSSQDSTAASDGGAKASPMGEGSPEEPANAEAGKPQGVKIDHGLVPREPERPERPLSKRAQGMSAAALRIGIQTGNVLAVVAAFNVTPGHDQDWLRETDGLQIGVVAAILAWRRWRKDAVRLPSGFRLGRDAWLELLPETRRDLARTLLGELGVETGIEAKSEGETP